MKLGMTEDLEDGNIRKFNPSKRLKQYHRLDGTMSLRQFARSLTKKNSDAHHALKTAAKVWMDLKGVK